MQESDNEYRQMTMGSNSDSNGNEQEPQARKVRIYEHSCPECLGAGKGSDCNTCGGTGRVREVW